MPATERLPLELWRHIANATLPESRGISCQTIDRPQQLWQNRSYRGNQDGKAGLSVNSSIHRHTFLSLSQACSAFLQLLAPTLYSHIAINQEDGEDMDLLPKTLIAQLVKTLERQIVRETVRRITLDLRILDSLTLMSGLNPWDELDDGWKSCLDWPDSAIPMSDFTNVLKATDQLAGKLVGLSLKHFEWRGFIRATPQVFQALARMTTLESVAFDWSYFLMPYSTTHYQPEPLTLLIQVKAAALGLGYKDHLYGNRHSPYNEQKGSHPQEELEELDPSLFGFLTGSNRLRYLFLAAPILYYQETLIPCWAKVHSITDDAFDRVSPPSAPEQDFPLFGEMSSKALGDEPFFLAATNFRRLLKEKAESTSRKMNRGLRAQDVVDLIWEQDLLKPWRQWFSQDCALGKSEGAARPQGGEKLIGKAEIMHEVIKRWNETASEELDQMEKKKFSDKSYFLLSAEEYE